MYALMGFGIAIVSIILSVSLGVVFANSGNRSERIRYNTLISWSIISIVLYGTFLWLSFWFDHRGVYGPTPFFWSLLVGFIIGAIIAGIATNNGTGASGGIFLSLLMVICAFGIAFFLETNIWTWKGKAELAGKVEVEEKLEDLIEPADPAHICLVCQDYAVVLAQTALSRFQVPDGAIPGSRYEIGTPTKQFVNGHLWWIFPIDFQGWLKWRINRIVPGYLRVSAEDPYASPQPVQTDATGQEINIQYENSACWQWLAERYLRTKKGYMGAILDDWTFEVDENWRPYYTVSVLKREYGWTTYSVEEILVLDLQTGDIQPYTLDKLPSWIDRAVPLHVLNKNINNWGMYSKAGWWYNLWHDDKSQKTTEGWYMVYDEKTGHCKWYSGFTSTNESDEALTGFVLADGRTGKYQFFKCPGQTEYMAINRAKGLWDNYGYTPASDIVPYNIYGHITYVIPMLSDSKEGDNKSKQFVGVTLVEIGNQIYGIGSTLQTALNQYRAAIATASANKSVPGGQAELARIEGIVERVGYPRPTGTDLIYPFTLRNVPKVFQVTQASSRNPKISVLQPGDRVVITYLQTGEETVFCDSFDIPDLVLTNESATQNRFDESQAVVENEVKRVQQQQDVKKVLNDQDLKDIDPVVLQKFLEQQRANQKQ